MRFSVSVYPRCNAEGTRIKVDLTHGTIMFSLGRYNEQEVVLWSQSFDEYEPKATSLRALVALIKQQVDMAIMEYENSAAGASPATVSTSSLAGEGTPPAAETSASGSTS